MHTADSRNFKAGINLFQVANDVTDTTINAAFGINTFKVKGLLDQVTVNADSLNVSAGRIGSLTAGAMKSSTAIRARSIGTLQTAINAAVPT